MQITLSLNLIIASLGLGISLTSLIQVWSSFELEKKTRRYFPIEETQTGLGFARYLVLKFSVLAHTCSCML